MRQTHAVPSCSSIESLRASRTPHAATSCSSVEPLRGSRTPQDYLNAITTAYPCPVLSGFERAYWLYQTREALKWIADFISEEYKLQLIDISAKGMTSEHYTIVPMERQESRVNIDRLREKFPNIFDELVHLRPSDANKIL